MQTPLFAFFGTPRFSVRVLNALEANGLLPALVVTAPDRARGRGMEVSPSPAKEWALARGIEVAEPATLKDGVLAGELRNSEWDVFIVAAYAKLIPKDILDIPRRGCLNVHPSLLPRFRGPSPVLSAILADERRTGVTIMEMAEKMDAGPVVSQATIELEEKDWPPRGSVFEDLLATEGGNFLAETLPGWLSGEITGTPQDESGATFTHKFTDEDARLVFPEGKMPTGKEAREALCKIRAFDKNPRAYFLAPGKNGTEERVIITEAAIEDGALVLLKVIPEGKKEMDYSVWTQNK